MYLKEGIRKKCFLGLNSEPHWNIARGTEDPVIESVTWIISKTTGGATWITSKFRLAPLELVANLTKRWRHLPFASRKFCHHMIPHSHEVSQFWPPGGPACTNCKFGHQEAPLASIANRSTKYHNWEKRLGGWKAEQEKEGFRVVGVCHHCDKVSLWSNNKVTDGQTPKKSRAPLWGPTSSWRPFESTWLCPSRPSAAQALWHLAG